MSHCIMLNHKECKFCYHDRNHDMKCKMCSCVMNATGIEQTHQTVETGDKTFKIKELSAHVQNTESESSKECIILTNALNGAD